MNINSMINKLLLLLASKNKLYKYNTFKFYSKSTERYSTKHQLLKRKIIRNSKNKEIEKYDEVKTSYSNREIFEYLMEELKRMG